MFKQQHINKPAITIICTKIICLNFVSYQSHSFLFLEHNQENDFAHEMRSFFRLFRDVSDGNDDMAGEARVLGVKIFFTTNAANDA